MSRFQEILRCRMTIDTIFTRKGLLQAIELNLRLQLLCFIEKSKVAQDYFQSEA